MIDPLDPAVTEALRAWRVQHSAGIGVAQALGNAATVCVKSGAGAHFAAAAKLAEQNSDIEKILLALAPAVPPAERALIDAGWQSGRVEQALDAVLAWRELWFNARRKIRAKMMLPAVVLLMASFVAPLPAFVAGGDLFQYAVSVGIPLLVAGALWRIGNQMFENRLRGAVTAEGAPRPPDQIDRLLLQVPVVSTVERQRNVGEACILLAHLIGAGVPVSSALEIGAAVLRNGIYREELARIGQQIRRGESLGSTIQAGPLWPVETAASINIGEKSGALDDVLMRAGKAALESYERAVEHFAEWLPRALYALIALFVIYNIFMLASNIFGVYSSAM